MKFLNVRLLVNDMHTSLAFYRDMMGFPVLFGDTDGEYIELTVGENVTLALFGREHMAQAVGTTHRPSQAECQDHIALIFNVENVDAAAAELKAKGVMIEVEATNHPDWMMRTAHFRDPDGNLIEINASLPQ